MENNTGGISTATKRNILIEIADKGTTKNAVAIKAGIPSSSFARKLEHPEQFTLKDIGNIALALNVPFTELLKDAA